MAEIIYMVVADIISHSYNIVITTDYLPATTAWSDMKYKRLQLKIRV